MKAIITVAEESIYHHTVIVETSDMEQLKKVLEKVEGNASDLYGVLDILEEHGVKVVEKDEDGYIWIEAAGIYEVREIADE